jgi:hypothetical protein
MSDKRSIIYHNNEYVSDYSEIIRILQENNCKYTTNSNGIFINLTTIHDDIIDKIYPFFINNTLDKYTSDYEYSTMKDQMNNESSQISNETRNYHEREESYTIPIDGFNTEEKKIIRYSANYFL